MTTRRHHPPIHRRRPHPTTAIALLAAGTFIGVTSQHLVSADVSSGDRPVLITIEPCRLADTLPAPNQVGPRSTPLGAADTHKIEAQQTGTPCSGKIPADASALSLNVTALGATELSFLTIWAGGDRPLAASLNPAPGQPPSPNAVTTELSVDQEFEIYNNAGSVNIVVDVNGYYVNHTHDDRYFTKSESDTRYMDAAEVDALIDAAIAEERTGSAGRVVAVGSVFANDPPSISSGATFAEGFVGSVTGPIEGRQYLVVEGPFSDNFPTILVTPILGVGGVTCRANGSSFSELSDSMQFSVPVDCADATGTPVDVSFSFAIIDHLAS